MSSTSPDLELQGARQVAADMRAAGDELDQVLDQAIDRIAPVAQAAIRRRAPRATGKLARYVSIIHEGDRTIVHASGRIAHLITGGTAPHAIVAHGHALELQGGGVVRFADSVRHPGTAPNPFVARGLDDARSDIDRIIDGAADDALDVIAGG